MIGEPNQLRLTVSVVTELTDKKEGSTPGQDMQELTSTKSIAISPVKLLPLV